MRMPQRLAARPLVAAASRGGGAGRARPRFRLEPRLVALMALTSGLAMPLVVDFVGLIYVTEILLLPTALVALLAARGHRALASPVLWTLIASGLLMLGGYVLSDLARATEPDLYIRGWAKGIFQVVDVVLLCVVVAADQRNFWWYAFGAALGGLLFHVAIEHAAVDSWKTTYAVPSALLVLCLGAWLSPRLVAAGLVAVALAGLVFDSRADPAIALLVAIAVWTRAGRPRLALSIAAFARRLLLPLLVGGLAFVVVFAATQGEYGSRREQSNLGRGLTFTLGWRAITMSPWIGYGSWSDNPAISKLQDEIVKKELGQSRAGSFNYGGFSPHSELLQSWYEGGLLAPLFFFTLLWWLWRALPEVVLRRPLDPLSGLLLFVMVSGLWHVLMSPFAGGHRLDNMLTAAAVLLVQLESRSRRAAPVPTPRAAHRAAMPRPARMS